jgi:hypothetical protein
VQEQRSDAAAELIAQRGAPQLMDGAGHARALYRRRTRTRRVIGKVAPDPALCVVRDEPATAATATRSRRGATERASSNAAAATLDVLGGNPAITETTATPAPREPVRQGSGAKLHVVQASLPPPEQPRRSPPAPATSWETGN